MKNHAHLSFIHLSFVTFPDAEGKDAAAAEANRKQLISLLDEAEVQLGKTPFLAGNAYSVADVLFTPILFRLGMAGKTGHYLKPRPNVSQYFDRSGWGTQQQTRTGDLRLWLVVYFRTRAKSISRFAMSCAFCWQCAAALHMCTVQAQDACAEHVIANAIGFQVCTTLTPFCPGVCRMKQRPSFQQTFGPASSTVSIARHPVRHAGGCEMLPAW